MQNTESKFNGQEEKIRTTIDRFFKEINIKKALKSASIRKARGYAVHDVLGQIFRLPFVQKNMYQGVIKSNESGFNKTVVYDLLNNNRYNWRKFLIEITSRIINLMIKPLSNESREDVFIIDDSSYPRDRSKKVELLAKTYDHVTGKYFKGFRLLQLGWSDGTSFVPVDFALLSSKKEETRYQEMNSKIDKRSCGYKRRKEAVSKATEVIAPMIKRAMGKGIKPKYVLMDSWFGYPAIISEIRQHINVICMVKDTSKIFYYVDGQSFTLSQLYRQLRKKRGNAWIKGSYEVEIRNGNKFEKVKIVFVRNRNKKRSWLALLSTDTQLFDADIVRIYGKRWDIEVFFKMAKQCLYLCKGVESRGFDAMIAHVSIVLLRYIFISLEQRKHCDGRTFGGVFLETIEEMKDITLIEALTRILDLFIKELRKQEIVNDEVIDKIFDCFIATISNYYCGQLKSA